MQFVEPFTNEIQEMRENADTTFQELYLDAESIAKEMDTNISMPRTTAKQTNRPQSSGPEEYHNLSLFIPFINFLLQEMNYRFLHHKAALESICCLLPEKCVELKDESMILCCEVLSQRWLNDIFDPLQLEGEMNMWTLFNHKESDLPQDVVS